MQSGLQEMAKFIKITEYHSAIGAKKSALCEMKSRDYRNEVRFQPYGFLSTGKQAHLFDFRAFNDCILSATEN